MPAVIPGVGRFAVGVLGGHAPAQVKVEELKPQLLDPLALLQEDDCDQMIPPRVHVVQWGGDDDADEFQVLVI